MLSFLSCVRCRYCRFSPFVRFTSHFSNTELLKFPLAARPMFREYVGLGRVAWLLCTCSDRSLRKHKEFCVAILLGILWRKKTSFQKILGQPQRRLCLDLTCQAMYQLNNVDDGHHQQHSGRFCRDWVYCTGS